MRRALDALVVAALAALVAVALLHAADQRLLFGDFRAFYCGGSVLAHGGDPYAQVPLYACESARVPFHLYAASGGIAVPAPFPGYALAFFALFSYLPYPLAALVWLAASCAALLIAAHTFARIYGFGVVASLLLLGVPAGIAILPYGELAPFVLCAVALAAKYFREERWWAAAAAMAVLALLPNVAAPAFLLVLLFERAMRVPLLTAIAALAGLDLFAGGPALALHYFAQVLPAHALSEIGATSQYGTTWVAHALGLSDALAVHVPEVLYALVVAGLLPLFARAGNLGRAEMTVAVALAWALLAGPFVHFAEVVLALPLGIALYAATRERAVALACIILAIPWLWIVEEPALCAAFAAFAFVTSRKFFRLPSSYALRVMLGVACASGLLLVMAHASGAQIGTSATRLDPSLAQASWAGYVRGARASTGAVWWMLKAPTWLALAILALRGAFFVAQKDDELPVAVSSVPASV